MSLIYDEYGSCAPPLPPQFWASACSAALPIPRARLNRLGRLLCPFHRPSPRPAGRPFIIIRDQESKTRLKGLDAQKANILAARTITNILRSSLGPKGAPPPPPPPPRPRAPAAPTAPHARPPPARPCSPPALHPHPQAWTRCSCRPTAT
jgi:hypothetical protein